MRTIKVSDEIWEHLTNLKYNRKIKNLNEVLLIELGLKNDTKE